MIIALDIPDAVVEVFGLGDTQLDEDDRELILQALKNEAQKHSDSDRKRLIELALLLEQMW